MYGISCARHGDRDAAKRTRTRAQANEGDEVLKNKAKRPNPHWGSSLDDLLRSQGKFEEFQALAIKETIAFQLQQAMRAKKMTKKDLAARMKTSRFQLDRVLDPSAGNVTLETLQRAAAALGRKLQLELI
jgi:antitoxin HicB